MAEKRTTLCRGVSILWYILAWDRDLCESSNANLLNPLDPIKQKIEGLHL